MLVLAHTAHWLTNLLYIAPVVVLGVFLAVQSLRERRRAGRAPGPPGAGGP